MARRLYTQKEWKLLSWWLATYHPLADVAMNVRVGPTGPIAGAPAIGPIEANASRLRNRWVDAVFFENSTVNIVEAKMNPDPGVFSQLVHYARKFRLDPNFGQYANWPMNLIALVYSDDPSVAVEAAWYGVNWIVYSPNLDGVAPSLARGVEAAIAGGFLPAGWPSRLEMLGIVPPS